jgi:Uma2 family endonuclease
MSAIAALSTYISPEDYLRGEQGSAIKHEYLGGVVHAMAGGKNVHSILSGNVFLALGTRLRGKQCRPFNSDTKVRVRLPNQLRFYYPDVQVVCEPNPLEDSFQDRPNVIVEVLSDSTRRTDEGEKLDAYTTIPSLEVYLLVDSVRRQVTAYHRTDTGFVRSIYTGLEGHIPLPCLGFDLPLSEIYEQVQTPTLDILE